MPGRTRRIRPSHLALGFALGAALLLLLSAFPTPGVTSGERATVARPTGASVADRESRGQPVGVHPGAVGRPSDRDQVASISAAGAALARGLGPAGGAPVECSHGGASATCRLAVPRPASSLPTLSWWNTTAGVNGLGGGPPASYGGAMAYDAYDGYVVYFGGSTLSQTLNDTWLFYGGLWHDITANLGTAPPAVAWPAMDYDAQFQVVLLYGGCGPRGCPDNETWYYTGGTGWTNLTAQLSPATPPLYAAALGYAADPSDGYSVLFGGCATATCSTVSNATFGFDGFGWISLPTLASPPSGWGQSFAYDPQLGALVLYGGCGSSSLPNSVDWITCSSNATWTYSMFAWSNATARFGTPTNSPPPRAFAVLTWDELDQVLLLFGGEANGGTRSDTWALSCAGGNCSWSNLTAAGEWSNNLLAHFWMSAPADSNASVGTMFFGGLWHGGPGGAYAVFVPSSGTFFRDAPLLLAPTVSPNAPARTPVQTAAHPSGGSGVYSAFAGRYNATWSSGGQTATGLTATFNFTQPGNHTILLSVTDAFGQTATAQIPYVATGPVSAILAETEAVVGVPCNLSAAPPYGGTAPYAFWWTFGDGAVGQGSAVTHVWLVNRTFTITLQVVDAEAISFSASQNITVIYAPSTSISVTPQATDAGRPVTFQASVSGGAPPYRLSWDFTDGSPVAVGNTTVHAFVDPGNYTVLLHLNDSLGITTTSTVPVLVNPALRGSASASAAQVDTATALTFTASVVGGTAPFSYAWEFGDGSAGTGESAGHRYTVPGTYVAHVWINDSVGASFSVQVTVTVSAAPGGAGGLTDLGSSGGLILAALAGVLLAAVVLAWRLRRRRAPGGEPPREGDMESPPEGGP